MTEEQRTALMKVLNKRIKAVTDRNEGYLADIEDLVGIALAATALVQLHQLGDLTPKTKKKKL